MNQQAARVFRQKHYEYRQEEIERILALDQYYKDRIVMLRIRSCFLHV